MKYKIKGKVWLYPGIQAAWHFLSIPKKEAEAIKKKFGANARGWGSLPVVVTLLRPGSGRVGKQSWKTSIFPDKKSSTYLLPLKAQVRKKEGIQSGDMVTFSIEVKI